MVSAVRCAVFAAGVWTVCMAGCAGRSDRSGENQSVIRVDGSDTMVNLAQAWAETYKQERPVISVQVLGSGTGVGIASLTEGTCDLANASRRMTEKEIQRIKTRRNGEPKEHIVGYDALAIYVHPQNPIESITIEELAEIYGDGGSITQWSQLGVKNPGGDEIQRISRQNSSGTYAYFRQAVLGEKRDFKDGSIDQSGSKDVVALISRTPSAIGYSGMGYTTPGVKMLKVSKKKGEPGIAPCVETARNDAYPITRPLLIYTLDEPSGSVKEYLDWIFSPKGQAIVHETGYVPVTEHDKQ